MARILVISPTPSHPQNAGNRARIFSLLSGLKSEGHQIFFVYLQTKQDADEISMRNTWDDFFSICHGPPVTRRTKRLHDKLAKKIGLSRVLPYQIDDWFPLDIGPQLLQLRNHVQPDIVLVEYVFLSKAFEYFGSNVLKVLDTHDIFGGRHEIYLKNKMKPRWFYTSASEEKKALDRADIIVAIQAEEAGYFERQTDRKVITVGHFSPVSKVSESVESAERLLFVGSGNQINVQGLRWFLDEVFPLLRQQLPNIELEVLGDCVEYFKLAEGVLLSGRVKELAPYYQRAKVVVNPVRFGTGLKIKTIESLAYGRPLVSTTAGVAGLEQWSGRAFLVADSAVDFAAAVVETFISERVHARLVNGAYNFTRANNQTTMQPLLETIREADKKL